MRTSRVGYLRDVRRLTVALSRARLGLYILGRRDVFQACYELKDAFDTLLKRPDKLTVVPGELFPTLRLLENEADGTEMQGVEHLGQYVYEMTQAKVADIKAAANGTQGIPQIAIEQPPEDLEMGEAEEDAEFDHTDDLQEREDTQQ